MKKIFRNFAILGLLGFGIFFAAFDSSSKVRAAYIDCQTCVEMQADCNWRCENGEIGCAMCTKKVDNCFANCRW